MKKKRTNNKEEGLRVDAIVFSADNRNNIAVDSKFPLENYLSLKSLRLPQNLLISEVILSKPLYCSQILFHNRNWSIITRKIDGEQIETFFSKATLTIL